MGVSIQRDENSSTPVLKVGGRVDAISCQELQSTLLEEIENVQENIVLDCSELEFVSSAGLRVFLLGQKAIQAKGGSLILKNVTEAFMKVLNMTGFNKLLVIEE